MQNNVGLTMPPCLTPLTKTKVIYCTVNQKKQATILLSVTSPISNQFLKFLHERFTGKFCNEDILNIPPHLICVTTLSCEILRSENSDLTRVLYCD